MAIMETTWYLPKERLYYTNYPEVHELLDQINDIEDYAKRVGVALNDYNSGTYNKIDVNIVTLQGYIDKCRSVTGTLGRAANVCFDLLIELRQIQTILQTIMFAYNRYGDQYVGTPTTAT